MGCDVSYGSGFFESSPILLFTYAHAPQSPANPLEVLGSRRPHIKGRMSSQSRNSIVIVRKL
jgi:hypothetical protein